MILEKETFEKFGYYPGDLKHKSNKRILVACDDCGKIREICKYSYSDFCRSCTKKGEKHPLFGKQHTKETREKMSEAHKGKHLSEEHKQKIGDAERGEKNHNYGKHHTKETRKKISETLKKRGGSFYGKHHSAKTLKKMSDIKKGKKASQITKAKLREARKHRKIPKHHTKPELIFEEICKKNNLPFKYTGDSSFWIGKNPSINPDFVECNGKKMAIEIFSYWHDPLRRHCKIPYSQTYEGRKKILKEYGWKLVVFWQEDLDREDAEQFVLNELKKQENM